MGPDIRDRLKDAALEPSFDIDVDQLHARARRTRLRNVTATVAVSVIALVIGVAAAVNLMGGTDPAPPILEPPEDTHAPEADLDREAEQLADELRERARELEQERRRATETAREAERARPGWDLLPDMRLPEADSPPADLAPLAEDTGVMIVGTYDGSAVFIDVDSRETARRELAELAPGDPLHRLIAGDGRVVLYGGERIYAMDPHPQAEPEIIAEATDFSVFVPAGVPDRLWVREGRTDATPREIRQINVHGETLIEPTVSPGGNLAIGLRDAVVLQRSHQLIVWDPASDEIIERVPGPFPMGSDGRRFAWCDRTCRELYLTDPSDGTTRLLLELPERATLSGYQGRISPDGRYLATPLCIDDRQRCALLVVDLETSRAITVADGRLGSTSEPAWSPNSQWIFTPDTTGGLVTYQVTRSEASRIPVEDITTPYGFGVVDKPAP